MHIVCYQSVSLKRIVPSWLLARCHAKRGICCRKMSVCLSVSLSRPAIVSKLETRKGLG